MNLMNAKFFLINDSSGFVQVLNDIRIYNHIDRFETELADMLMYLMVLQALMV
jgi:hypothetical protein